MASQPSGSVKIRAEECKGCAPCALEEGYRFAEEFSSLPGVCSPATV
jgi:hypothetical protein